ncbi:MAG: ATP synthase F1 subunit epsilon [Mariniblastus sp.]
MAQLQLVIVTPETTTFDSKVDGVTLPLIDGEAGVLPGHAAMIGRLGPGEVRTQGATAERFYVDGGFVQIEGGVVSILTGKSMPVGELDLAQAKADLEAAENQESGNADLAAIKQKAVAQARARIRLAERA